MTPIITTTHPCINMHSLALAVVIALLVLGVISCRPSQLSQHASDSTCSAPSVRVITSPLCLPTTPESNNSRHSCSDVPVASLTTTTANYPTTLFTAHSSTLWDEQNAIYSRRRNTAMLQYNPSHPNALKLPSSLRKAVSASLGTSHR